MKRLLPYSVFEPNLITKNLGDLTISQSIQSINEGKTKEIRSLIYQYETNEEAFAVIDLIVKQLPSKQVLLQEDINDSTSFPNWLFIHLSYINNDVHIVYWGDYNNDSMFNVIETVLRNEWYDSHLYKYDEQSKLISAIKEYFDIPLAPSYLPKRTVRTLESLNEGIRDKMTSKHMDDVLKNLPRFNELYSDIKAWTKRMSDVFVSDINYDNIGAISFLYFMIYIDGDSGKRDENALKLACYPGEEMILYQRSANGHAMKGVSNHPDFPIVVREMNKLRKRNKSIYEGIRDKMTPKSEDEINKSIIKTMNDNDNSGTIYPEASDSDFQHIADLFGEPMENLFVITELDSKWEVINGYLSKLVREDDNYIFFDELDGKPIGGEWFCYPERKIAFFKYRPSQHTLNMWAYCKPFTQTLNESVRDKMTPKSKEEIVDTFLELTKEEKKKFIWELITSDHDTMSRYHQVIKWFSYDRLTDYDMEEILKKELYSKTYESVRDINEGIRNKMTPKSKDEIAQSFVSTLNNIDCPVDECISGSELLKDMADILGEELYNLHVIWEEGREYNYNSIDKYFSSIIKNMKYVELESDNDNEYICCYPSKKLAQYFYKEDAVMWIYSKPFYCGDINEGIRDKMISYSENDINNKLHERLKRILIQGLVQYNRMVYLKMLNIEQLGSHISFDCYRYIPKSVLFKNEYEIKDEVYEQIEDWFKKKFPDWTYIEKDLFWEGFRTIKSLYKNKRMNESIRDKMTPKSDDDIKMQLMSLSLKDKLEMMSKHDNKKTYKKLLNKYITDDVLKKDAEKESADTKILLGWKYNIPWLLENGIEEGGDISEKGKEIMRFACFNGYYNIVKLLLDKGVSANSKSALSSAVEKGYIDIVKILLEAGADPHQNDNYPITCSSCSYAENSLEIYELLKKYSTQDFSRIDKLISNRRMKG